MQKSLKRFSAIMNDTYFKEIAKYSKSFLISNINKLACQKNESGFVRVSIPITTDAKAQFKGIKKIRANYWTPEANVNISPESIHTHPSYFESFIIRGGYSHEIYELSDGRQPKYNFYRILKNGSVRNCDFIGQVPLKLIKNEAVRHGSIKVFNKDMIHKVLYTAPKTLSLNVVFDDHESEHSFYNLYLTKDGSLDDIKTTRDVLLNEKSHNIIQEIAMGLEEFVKPV